MLKQAGIQQVIPSKRVFVRNLDHLLRRALSKRKTLKIAETGIQTIKDTETGIQVSREYSETGTQKTSKTYFSDFTKGYLKYKRIY